MKVNRTLLFAGLAVMILSIGTPAAAGDCASVAEDINRDTNDWATAAKDIMPDVVKHSRINTKVLELNMEAMQAHMEAVNAETISDRAQAIDRYEKLYSNLNDLKPVPPTRDYETEWNQIMADKDDLHKHIQTFLESCPPSASKSVD